MVAPAGKNNKIFDEHNVFKIQELQQNVILENTPRRTAFERDLSKSSYVAACSSPSLYVDPNVDPKKTPSTDSQRLSGVPAPSLLEVALLNDPKLVERVSKAIQFIESQKHGKVDTLRSGGELRNSYHFHISINDRRNVAGLSDTQKVEYAMQRLKDDPSSLLFYYHTEESTERFVANSPNRYLVDRGNGTLYMLSCEAIQNNHDSRPENGIVLAQPSFAIVEPDSIYYSRAHQLPDGRRFIIWLDRKPKVEDLLYRTVQLGIFLSVGIFVSPNELGAHY